MARYAWCGVLAAGMVCAAGLVRVVHAADVPVRTVGLDRVDNQLTVSVGLQDLFARVEPQKLMSGFATRVVVRVYLYRGDTEDPIATAYQHAEIVYDIWDERFAVRVTDSAQHSLVYGAASVDQVVARAAVLWRFALADARALLPGVPYRVGVRADLNPLSDEVLADVRRTMMRTPAQGARAGDSFFGSFVSIFVNPRIEESERQVHFLSQVFFVTTLDPGPPP